MQRETVNKLVLLALVIIISTVFLSMIVKFLMPIFMAGLFAAMLTPAHQWLSTRFGGREHLASVVLISAIVLLVLTPLTMLIGIVVSQALTVSQSVTPFIQKMLDEPSTLTHYLENVPFYDLVLPYRDLVIERAGQIVGVISSFLVNSLSSVTKLTIHAIFGSIIMLYAMFYFLIMGDVLLERILYFLPLRDQEEQRLLSRFTSVTRATIKGSLIIGVMQGAICGLAFSLASIQGPVFWGTVMAVTSIIPAFGTALVWVPALIILALMGDFTGVAVLVVLCGLTAGNLDNILRPRLVGKDTEMHDLFVLFSTLGGISMFGILGIIIGPIIAALFITIWEIYGKVFADYLPDVETTLRRQRTKEKDNGG